MYSCILFMLFMAILKTGGFWSHEMSHVNVMKQLIRKGPVNYFSNIAKCDAIKNSLSLHCLKNSCVILT